MTEPFHPPLITEIRFQLTNTSYWSTFRHEEVIMDSLFSGLGTAIVILLLGGSATAFRLIKKAKNGTKMIQKAGDNATQKMIFRQENKNG